MEENKIGKCISCKEDGAAVYYEDKDTGAVFICEKCLEKAKTHFLIVCIGCGSSFAVPKKHAVERSKDEEVKYGLELLMEEQVVIGVSECVNCEAMGGNA